MFLPSEYSYPIGKEIEEARYPTFERHVSSLLVQSRPGLGLMYHSSSLRIAWAWKRLLPFFQLLGTITQDAALVQVELRPFNDRVLNRDLAVLAESLLLNAFQISHPSHKSF